MGKNKNCKISHLITSKSSEICQIYKNQWRNHGMANAMGLKIQISLCAGELTKNVQLLRISEFHGKKQSYPMGVEAIKVLFEAFLITL